MEIKSLHTHVDIVSRSKGHSVLAKAAYNARDKLRDEYYVKIHDYSKKDDLVFSKIFLPEHIPKEFSNREYLWNSVEKIEKSKNSQLARNLLFTLPRELNEEDRIKLISEFIEENFTSKGMIADCNIHNPVASDNEEQPHAHILLTLREIDEKGNWKPKSRKEYILDENGEKIKLKSGNYKSRKVNLNDWNEPDKAKEWRENFSKKANEYLAKNNIDKRIDPRTFEEQGREELPQIHLGTSSYQMEKKGIQTERGNHNRKIIALNVEVKKLKEEIAEIGSWILSLVNMVKGFLKGFSKEKQKEYNRTPDLFDVYSYLETYYKIQKELSKNLSYDSRMRKEHFDSKKYVKALSYMSSNNLKTIIDIQCKKDEVLTKLKENKESIADCSRQIKNIDTLIKQAKIMRENKTVYDRYKGADNSIFSKIAGASKEEYYNSHKEEIDKYIRANSILKKLSRSEKIETKKWEKEKAALQKEINHLSFNQKFIKEEISQINHIKYVLGEVNKDFGIDINIEIEIAYKKAIARGEKPSVKMALEEFQRQIKKEDRQKAWAKEHYKNKDHIHKETER
ncbi:MobA/MobL family protein [Streptococcus suis]|uniref:ATP-dependent exoDNAse (Exonuclease V) subunit alpha n=1 Tax=Streptococcus suis TaxID=1307 RepID=A0A822VJY6_STRSU|nr:MobQ family relaxase [Streptococcus suis]AGZ23059.1 nickase [Streptococcus suis T15]MCB2942689.1 MobA/MobL family protein [Streptococcus suis]MCB2951685.1 MobA/MobL family protein [Streptococcus suis]MCB2957538.1 MobA/MobL family protein [Streptococcus suis]MCG9861831.1 MobA/MobL family protein [Streptococcus suis]